MRTTPVDTAIERQPDPCPPHTPGSSGEWANRCTKCGAPC